MKEVKDWHIEVGDCMEINSSDEEESKVISYLSDLQFSQMLTDLW